jgi:hypothetical protein
VIFREIHDILAYLGGQIRGVHWTEHKAQMAEITNSFQFYSEIPEENRPPGTLKCRWSDNIKVDIKEIRYEVVDWM